MAREYRLLDTPDAGKRLERYVGAVRRISLGDLEYFLEDRWSEYEQSRDFGLLTDRERMLARYTFSYIVDEEKPWLVGEGDDTDNLFGLPGARFTIPSTLDDAMILSGVRGWEITKEIADRDRRTRDSLGTLALRDYVDVAIATALYGDNSSGEADLSYFVEDGHNTTVRKTVGGTFHGDFAAGWKRFATSGPSIDPIGIRREFAPSLENDFVRGYHSIETELAVGMLTYLAAGDAVKLEAFKHTLVELIDDADMGRGGGNFADFGSNGMGRANEIFADDFRQYHAGDVLKSFIVIPGNTETRLQLVATEDGVLLRNIGNVRQVNGSKATEVLGTMPISAQEIPQFIATMAAASAGRTSLAEIRTAIANARVWGR